MKSFWLRFALIVLVAIIQTAFFNVVFPAYAVPNILLATALGWTLLRGFFVSWPWVVGLGLVADLISLTPVGITALWLSLFAYAGSFISRRFLLEHQGFGTVTAGAFAAGSALAYVLLENSLRLVWGHAYGAELAALAEKIAWQSPWLLVGNAILFFVMYRLLFRLERHLELYEPPIRLQK